MCAHSWERKVVTERLDAMLPLRSPLPTHRLLPLLAGLAALSACVSPSVDRGDVVERSAEKRPAWVGGDFSLEGTGEVSVVHHKTGITRLELGIKQAQSAGMDQGCRLVRKRIGEELAMRAQEAQVSSEALTRAIESSLGAVEARERCPEVSPKFVYWELLRKDTAESSRQAYDVYVLLTMKKRQYLDALSVVVESVRSSGAPGADGLADRVSQSYNDE
jgi:hypothetical protein